MKTFRELTYQKQQADVQDENAYGAVLEQVRGYIAKTHAEALAQSITEKAAAETVKQFIAEYLGKHSLHIDALSMQQLADRLYGDMVGFGFLDKYIADSNIEEINGNSWRDIEVVGKTGWHKIPERFLSPQHAEDTLRKMVRLGGLVLDGTNPIVDSYITQGIRISAMIPPVADKRSGAVFSIRRQRMTKVTKAQLVEWQTATPEMLDFLVATSFRVTSCPNRGSSSERMAHWRQGSHRTWRTA